MMKTICILSLLAIGLVAIPAASASVLHGPSLNCEADAHVSVDGGVHFTGSGGVECEWLKAP